MKCSFSFHFFLQRLVKMRSKRLTSMPVVFSFMFRFKSAGKHSGLQPRDCDQSFGQRLRGSESTIRTPPSATSDASHRSIRTMTPSHFMPAPSKCVSRCWDIGERTLCTGCRTDLHCFGAKKFIRPMNQQSQIKKRQRWSIRNFAIANRLRVKI